MTMNFDFTDRTVLVTGAAQGIGRSIASLFHHSGAHVVVADRDVDRLSDEWPRGERVLPLGLDVADTEAVSAAVQSVLDWSGRLDILINNAGITRDAVVWKLTDADWDAVLQVHLGGAFALTRAVIPSMRREGYGRIVNVTSYTGLHGNVGQANYAAAKAGIVGLTKAVGKEVASFGITVNAVSPNASTSMVADVAPDRLAQMTAMIPQGRFAPPDELAATFAFLASEEAGYITGAVIPVDGGLSM